MASSCLGPAEIVDSGALLATLIPPPAPPPPGIDTWPFTSC